jgi:hypothetical protein
MLILKMIPRSPNVLILLSLMMISRPLFAADADAKPDAASAEQNSPTPSDSNKESPPQPAVNQPAAVQPANNEGGLNMKYKGITINFGGFIEAAGIYRDKNMNSDVATPFQKLPLSNSAGYYQHETRFSARQTRLSLLVKGDVSPQTHLAGYYEMDFLGAAPTANSNESNSFNLRIRHLYATVDWDAIGLHLLAGQNWSLTTLNDKGITPRNEMIPSVIDAQYVPGFTWARQPQIRIAWDLKKKFWLALSVENPQTTYVAGPNASAGSDVAVNQSPGSNFAANLSSNTFPDIIVKAALEPGWGHYEIFDMVRVFRSNISGNGKVKNRDTTIDAVGAGFILPLVPKMLNLQASATYGKGIGRYGAGQLPDVTVDPEGKLVPIKELQVLAGLKFDLTSDWSFYAYYGREQVERTSWDQAGKGYGYGSSLYNTTIDKPVSSNQGQVRSISQATGGGWWKFYQGRIGVMQAGLQYSFTDNGYFKGTAGAPYASESIAMASLRYYW